MNFFSFFELFFHPGYNHRFCFSNAIFMTPFFFFLRIISVSFIFKGFVIFVLKVVFQQKMFNKFFVVKLIIAD